MAIGRPRVRRGPSRLPGAGRGADRELGGAVGVGEAASRGPALGQLRRAGLAGHDEGAQLRKVSGGRHRERRRRQGDVGDAAVAQEGCQGCAGQKLFAGSQVELGPGLPGDRQLRDEGVEARRGELEDAVVRGEIEDLHLRPGQAGDAAVGDGHALGSTGRARGVDDIGQGPFTVCPARRGRGCTLPAVRLRVEEDEAGGVPAGEDAAEALFGDQQGHAGIRQQEGDALSRQARIERHPGAARLEDGEDGGHQPGRAVEAEPDSHLRPDAFPQQALRQPVRPPVQLAIGEHLARSDQGRPVRPSLRLLLEDPVQGERRHFAGRVVPAQEELVPLCF